MIVYVNVERNKSNHAERYHDQSNPMPMAKSHRSCQWQPEKSNTFPRSSPELKHKAPILRQINIDVVSNSVLFWPHTEIIPPGHSCLGVSGPSGSVKMKWVWALSYMLDLCK